MFWGERLKPNIKSQPAARYGLVERGWRGTLSQGVTRIEVPHRYTVWIIRADRYTSSGQNLTAAATRFRATLRLASLPAYGQNPSVGASTLPLALFAPRMKAIADQAIAF